MSFHVLLPHEGYLWTLFSIETHARIKRFEFLWMTNPFHAEGGTIPLTQTIYKLMSCTLSVRGATTYLFPRAASKLHSDSSPQVAQHFPSGPISISLPFCTSKPIIDMTAEGCAFMQRLISAMLNPFCLFSKRLTSCASIALAKPQQQPTLIHEEGKDPCYRRLIHGRCNRPRSSKLMFDSAQCCHTGNI
jgi:hypothetical protein